MRKISALVALAFLFVFPLALAKAQTSGLVAAYSFDEGTGTTVNDLSANGNVGTISNATWTTQGKYGKALQFNGSNAKITIPASSSLNLTAGMTLEAWVNASTNSAGWRDLIYKAPDIYYLEATSSSGPPAGAATFSSGKNRVYGTSALPVGAWTHLALTYDGSALRLYVNGTQVSSVAQSGSIATSSNAVQIGGDSLYGQYFSGLIDEVRIYNVALSQAAIQTDMNTPLGSGSSTQTVAVAVSPQSATLASGDTQQFTATVSGTSNTAVTWSASSGTISTSGLFTAPTVSSTTNVTVRATSQADTTKSASALVTVNPPSSSGSGGGGTAGLVAAYSFDENTGTTVNDVSGKGNTGTISGGATWTTGKYGSALKFSGSSRVNISDSASLHLSSGMTLEAWVNPTASSSRWQDLIYKGNDIYYLEGASTQGGVPAAGGTWTSGHGNVFASTALAAKAWTHIATTYDGSSLRLYINGIQVASQPRTGSLASSTNPLQIGGDSLYGQYFSGLIDEVRIYNVALSPAQIQGDMSTPVASGSGSGSSVAVSLVPTSATVNSGGTQQFTATVTGTSNTSVAWSASLGTISGSGLYTAPTVSSNTTAAVTATSAADPTKSASASVTITAPAAVSVAISPTSASLAPGGTKQFTATVSGSSNTSVTWSASGGTVSSSGLYTAPSTTGTYTVKATSVADSTKSASATVTVASSSGGGGAANSWANRTAGVNLPGGAASIVSSYSFDNTISLPHCASAPCWTYSPGAQSYFTYYYDAPNSFSTDCSVGSDGCAMKIAIAPGYHSGDPGYWDYNFSPNLAATFGPGQEFYVQYRERVSANMIKGYTGGEGFKSDITTEGDTASKHAGDCSNSPAEFVTQQDGSGSAYPMVYFNCGYSGGQYAFMQSGYQTMQLGGVINSNYLDQDAAGCPHYSGAGIPSTDPTCWNYVGDEWFTIQKHVKVGQWGQPNSVVEIWIAHNGQPARLVSQAADAALPNDGSGGASGKYGKIQFSVYNTNGTWQVNSAAWYDDLIVSTRRIPDPNVSTPNAPDSLTVSNVTTSSAQVNWRVNSHNGSAQDDTGFVVERCTGNAAACFPNPQSGFSAIATTAAGVSSYVDRTLVHGTTYTYRVKAINSSGSSGYAAGICFNNTTGTCGGTAKP